MSELDKLAISGPDDKAILEIDEAGKISAFDSGRLEESKCMGIPNLDHTIVCDGDKLIMVILIISHGTDLKSLTSIS
jgi:hypothetical protein